MTSRTLPMATLATLILLTTGCIPALSNLKEDRERLIQQVQAQRQDLEKEIYDRKQAETISADLQTRVEELRARIESLETQLKDANLALEKSNQEKLTLQDRLETQKRVLTDAQKAQAESIMSDMEERMNRENELRFALEQAESAAEGARAQMGILNGELEDARSEYKSLLDKSAALTDQYEALRKQAESVTAERDDARAERDDFRRQLQSLKSTADDSSQQIAALSESLRDQEKQLLTARRQAEESARQAGELSEQIQQAAKRKEDIRNVLRRELKNVPSGAGLDIPDGDKVIVRLSTDFLFESGSTELCENGRTALKLISKALSSQAFETTMIVGHTDNVPLRNLPYVDNWDLAAARALAATRYIASLGEVPTRKLEAVSRAYHDPIDSNDTASGRAKNRRVEIIVQP